MGKAKGDCLGGGAADDHHAWRWRVGLVGVVLTAGCSFTARAPDPARPAHVAPDCTQDAYLPMTLDILSGLAASGSGVLLLTAGIYDCLDDDYQPGIFDGCSLAGFGVVYAAIGAIYGAAVVYGAQATRACRKDWQRHRDWLALPAKVREREAKVHERDAKAREDRDREECAGVIRAWQTERDLRAKTARWEIMAPKCQKLIERR